jgi:hypothetical protein
MSKKIIEYGDFVNLLVAEFPEIRDEIESEDYEGLLSLQLGVFRNFTQQAIDTGNIPLAQRCLSFVNSILGRSEYKVENSLYLSYLMKLNFQKNPSLVKMLSKEILANVEGLRTKQGMAADSKLRGFLDSLNE